MSAQNPMSDARTPRFSIIINVYNGERFLSDALDSVFAQTFGNWELIFWDDQSTDGSAEVLRRYPADPRVRYFYAPEHTALGKARELAIAEARGEWLAFLDQDDIWTVDKLEKQARVVDLRKLDKLAIVYGRAMTFGDGFLVRDFDRWHEFSDLPEGRIFDVLFVDSCFICQSAVCLKSSAVRAIGRIPAEYRYCPDYFLYAKLMTEFTAACTQDVVCWYRLHGESMSREHYMPIQREMLSIAERWKDRLHPAVYRRRCRIQYTLYGLREITSGENPIGGLARILRDGSVPYLFSRPFVKTYRGVRRAVRYALHGMPRRPRFS